MTRARKERGAVRSQTSHLLKDLGPTADAVATHLETAGVKGVPGSGTGCAVARYLNAVMSSDSRLGPISVNNEAVTIFGRHWWTPPVVVAVPPPVRGFIVRFDREEFHGLAVPPANPRRQTDALKPDPSPNSGSHS
jgi:hypothetical protein